jgi:mRNA interferase HigB
MRIVTRKRLQVFWEKHPNAKTSLMLWITRITDTKSQNLVELHQIFPSADLVGNFTVFNIGGNNYRLIAYIDYKAQIVFIRSVLTHAEYDKEKWKDDNWYDAP